MIKLLKNCINAFALKFVNKWLDVNIQTKKIRLTAILNKQVKLGIGCYIGKNVFINGAVSIGNYTSISDGETEINAEKSQIIIGNYSSIGRNFFPRTSQHYVTRLSTSSYLLERLNIEGEHFKTVGKIEIGNDVWIGANVTILGGIKVGDGAVIGAGSVVTKDLPPFSISVGVPAKVINYRFSDELIKEICESQWWNCKLNELQNKTEFFMLDINEEKSVFK